MKLVIGNQKAYLGYNEALSFIEGLAGVLSDNTIMCPSNIYLNELQLVHKMFVVIMLVKEQEKLLRPN